MKKFISFSIIMLFLGVVGCSVTPRHNPYTQPSPQIEARKTAGYEQGAMDRTDERYKPSTTIESTTNQRAETHRIITFDYRVPKRNKKSKVSNCLMYVKSSDTTQFDPIKCNLDVSGVCSDQLIVKYKVKKREHKAFDLYSHSGKGGYVGGVPPCISGKVFGILGWRATLGAGSTINLRYESWSEDPNK